jgi:FMN reductase
MSALVTKIGIQAPAATDAPLILGIGGTLRPTSSSERALAVSLEAVREAGGRTMSIVGRDLSFPPYEPGMEFDENARRFVSALRQCDGLIISGPSYHGGISGLLKNAIDYIEDMAGDERPYLTDRPVGMIVCAAGWQAVGTTLSGLRSIVHALRGWPTPLGAALNTAERDPRQPAAFSEKEQRQLREVAKDVVRFAVNQRMAGGYEGGALGNRRAAAGGA